MGGRFKREGIYVYVELIHVDVWQKTKFCKAIILQLKNKFKKRKKKGKKEETHTYMEGDDATIMIKLK